jgi:hypothetical protein
MINKNNKYSFKLKEKFKLLKVNKSFELPAFCSMGSFLLFKYKMPLFSNLNFDK